LLITLAGRAKPRKRIFDPCWCGAPTPTTYKCR
jgi:hypothetical protein